MNAIHPMQTGNTFKPNKKTGKRKQNPLKDQRVVDYLDAKYLSRFTNDQGKILPRRITGNCAKHQRALTVAVKRARHISLMPYTID